MKKYAFLTVLTALVLLIGMVGSVQAEIIPPHGEGQIGLQAVVLCEELTMRQEPNASSKAVETLSYGFLPIVMEQKDGWAYCVDGDSEYATAGWINADYLAIDPAWYRTDAKTPVYAWAETTAPKLALLNKGVSQPILKEEGDWLLISLRGAVGWVQR
jgi:SH3-like domain-containing protein